MPGPISYVMPDLFGYPTCSHLAQIFQFIFAAI